MAEVNDVIVDTDVHNVWSSDEVLKQYMTAEWQRYFFQRDAPHAPFARYGRFQPPLLKFPKILGTTHRAEAAGPGGTMAGSHYETLYDQLINPHKIDRAVLTWSIGINSALSNAAATVALCRAANDYLLDYWLSRPDQHLYGTINVPMAVPTEAAKEIRRVGKHPRVAGVLVIVNPFNKALGHPVYEPIYEAAAEMSLPIVTHLGGVTAAKNSFAAGGMPTGTIEYYSTIEQAGMHNLTSLISEGVLEKYPQLKFLFNESGFTWLPWVLWGLDARFKELQRESPTLKLLPSEYFNRQVWFGTQPIAGEASSKKVIELLEGLRGLERKLCYSSDYPHWDAEWPNHVMPRLPSGWRAGVMGLNACNFFDWSPSEIIASRPKPAIHHTNSAA